MALIEAFGLTKHYGQVKALEKLDLAVEPGVIGLVGANGAGKSTMLKILLGVISPTSGRATVLGMDVVREASSIRKVVGYMPEHDCLPPDVSATEFVTHMARISGLPRSAARERTAEVLRHVGLYAYRVSALRQLAAWQPTPLESTERLEQLRALERGLGIAVAMAAIAPGPGVDTEADLERVAGLLAAGSTGVPAVR